MFDPGTTNPDILFLTQNMPPGQLFVIITGSFIDMASNKAFGAPSNLEDKTNNVDFLYQEYGFTNPLKEILFFKLKRNK